MNVFGIGLPELAVIAAIGLLVFGPKRLPELGRTLGRTLKGFQSASSEFEKEFRSAIAVADDSVVSPNQAVEMSTSAPQAGTEAVVLGTNAKSQPAAEKTINDAQIQ